MAKTDIETINKMLDDSRVTFVTWKPTTIGEILSGKIVKCDIAKKHGTPFLVVQQEDKSELTVYISASLLQRFLREEYIVIADEEPIWVSDAKDKLVGSVVHIRYNGEQKSSNFKGNWKDFDIVFSI